MQRKITIAIISILLAVVLAGCDKQPISLSNQGELKILMTDSPAGFDAVNIVVKSVQVNSATHGWITINDSLRTFNLLSLTNGASVILGDAMLDAGHYTQIRLILDEGSNVVVNGVTYPLRIPSGLQTGIKLIHEFTLQADYTYELMLDFDANRSINQLGNGTYQMKPVIRIHPVATTGAITGIVTPIGAGATVTASAAVDTAGTNVDTLSGQFRLIALPPASYTVYFAAWDTTTYRDTALVNVGVNAGQTTNVGVVPLPHK
ncbi:MAG TPA: DUF4382 domain-containing protein [Bacteroidota bacterium]|nr:DUF4382 domain-containing protein [Bacteroidota bacterium]